MRIDWDVPIVMDDGLTLRADVYRPVAEGRYPALVSYGPYGKGLAFQDGYKTAWEIMEREFPDTVARHDATSTRTGKSPIPRSGCRDGYVCVRVDSRGAGRSPGYLDHNNARENRDFHDCIEWAAAQAWCERQGGAERHLLLREQPVARGGAAAAASRGDLRLGRLGRLLPRRRAPRRHRVHVPQELAGDAGRHGAARARRARAEEPRHRRARLRRRDALRRGAEAEPRATCGATSSSRPLDRRLLPRAHGGPLESDRAAPLGGELGRPGTAHARQLRRLRAARPRSRNGSKCTAARTGRRSTPTTASSSRSASSIISSRARTTAGTSSRACCSRCATSTSSCSATRTNGRSRARSGRATTSISRSARSRRRRPRGAAKLEYDAHGRRRHVHDAAARARDGDHGTFGAQALPVVVDDRRRRLRGAARLRPAGPRSRVPGRARSAHADRARGGCAPRTASSTRSRACPTARGTRTTRSSRSRRARSRARRRDLADVHRRARRVTASRSRSAARTTSTKARRRCSRT